MKILHVVHNYYPSVGGTQYLFQNISEKLVADYEDEVTVFTTDSFFGPQRKQYKKIKEKENSINGVKVIRFSYFKLHFVLFDRVFQLCNRFKIKIPDKLKQLRIGPLSLSLRRALLNTDFDVVCASASSYTYMQYPLYRQKGLYAKPFVFMGALHLSDNAANDHLFKQTLEAIKASEYFIANTYFERDRLISYGVKEDNINVIGCGIDLVKYEAASVKSVKEKLKIENNTVIGYFGRHDKVKGIDMLLYVFELLSKTNSNVVLVIGGSSSDYTKEIKNIIKSFDVETQQKCFLLEDIEEENKAALFHTFDIFVYPSIQESFGIVFLEAWACKKPVIGVNTGAVSAVITHEKDGFLIEPNNADQLSRYCTTLIKDVNLRHEMGENGYRKVKERYTWDIVTNKYRAVYGAAISKYNCISKGNTYPTNVPER